MLLLVVSAWLGVTTVLQASRPSHLVMCFLQEHGEGHDLLQDAASILLACCMIARAHLQQDC